jgi:crossover junction endodeoxyribonuclease RuvC
MYILAVDPGFAKFGYSIISIGKTADEDKPVRMRVLTTKKSNKKANRLAAEDNIVRAQYIAQSLLDIRKRYDYKVICAETMSYPRSSSAAAKMSYGWGVLVCLSTLYDIPILQNSPQEIKKSLCGKNNASKQEIQDKLNQVFSRCDWLSRKICRTDKEHCYDALAAYYACRKSTFLQLLRQNVA